MFGDLVGLDFGGEAGGDWFGGIGDLLTSLLGSAGDAIGQNPTGALGAGVQGAGMLAPLFMQQNQAQMPELGQQSQIQQGGATNQQVARRRLGDAQNQGMSGASPDFLATMAGVTPEELSQMMGWGGMQR